ncbi:uncharacterized protein LOC134340489 [Mobula hypostoma]|uniref:uncharacterized protein LOC134340489 n=1 Tax=Mobula hypostoma TaxID=723540 RepID=UPI002FC36867
MGKRRPQKCGKPAVTGRTRCFTGKFGALSHTDLSPPVHPGVRLPRPRSPLQPADCPPSPSPPLLLTHHRLGDGGERRYTGVLILLRMTDLRSAAATQTRRAHAPRVRSPEREGPGPPHYPAPRPTVHCPARTLSPYQELSHPQTPGLQLSFLMLLICGIHTVMQGAAHPATGRRWMKEALAMTFSWQQWQMRDRNLSEDIIRDQPHCLQKVRCHNKSSR